MTRKIIALLLSLMLVLGASSAFASGIIFSAGDPAPAATEAPAAAGSPSAPAVPFEGAVKYDAYCMDDGLCFIVPAGWQREELPVAFKKDSGFLYCTDAASGLQLHAWVEYVGTDRTPQQHSEIILADTENYKSCMLATNDMGQNVIAFVSADMTKAGGCLLSPNGFAIYFAYSRIDGTPLLKDELAQKLAAEICRYIHFTDLSGTASIPSGGEETVLAATFNGNFTMPIPEGWTEEPLRETDLHRMTAPDGDLYFYLRVNSYDNALPANLIYQTFSESENFTGCELLTGKDGLGIVRVDAEDLSFSTLMIPDNNGNVYILTFGSHDGNRVTDNAQLAEIRDMMVNGIAVD